MVSKKIHTTRSRRRGALALASGTALAIALAGCGTVADTQSGDDASGELAELNWRSSTLGSTTSTVDGDRLTVDTGDTVIDVDASDGLKIAFFNAALNTTYTQAMAAGVEAMAAEIGAEVTAFEAGWDPNTQIAQIENAIGSGEYNAFIVYAAEGSAVCSILTEDAPAAGIAVIPVITPLCGRTLARGEELIAPGTVSTVMGGGIVEYYEQWADYVSSQITEPTNVIYVAGPNAQDVVVAAEEAVRNAAEQNPNFTLLEVYYGDYSGDVALQAMQNALVTHPETNVVLSHFSTMTIGILKALSDAERSDIRVFDLGGDKTMKQPIEDGSVIASVPYFPYTAGVCGVDILGALFAGETVPQLVLSECGKGGEDTSVQTNVVIDATNVADFAFEY